MTPAYPKPAARSKRAPDVIEEGVKLAVQARSGGICEGCGAVRAREIHHRKFRSRGGLNTPDNLLHLCGWGNHTGCHGRAHSGDEGKDLGWAVPPWQDPARTKVIYRGEVRFLTADGFALTAREFAMERPK